MSTPDSLSHLFPPAPTAQSPASQGQADGPAKESDVYLEQLVDEILAVAKPKSAHS